MTHPLNPPINMGGGRIFTPSSFPTFPQLAPWLAKHPDIRALLDDMEYRAAAHDAAGEGGRVSFQQARETYDIRKAELAVLYDDARSAGAAPNPEWVKAKEAEVAEARRRLDNAEGISQPSFRKRDAELNTRDRCLKLLNAISAEGGQFTVVVAKPVGNTLKDVELANAAVRAIADRREDIVRAPLTLDTAVALATTEIETLANNGLRVVLGASGKPILRWPMEAVTAAPELGVIPVVTDASALVASLFPDLLIESAKEQLTAIYRDVPLALDPLDKKSALEAIDAELEAAERKEAATVWAARTAGHNAEWRKDISPKAVLGVA